MKNSPNILLIAAILALSACSSGSDTGSSDATPEPLGTSESPTNNDSVPQPDTETGSGPAPTLSLNASDTVVDSGGNVSLNWSSQNADSCNASGGWSGDQGVNGQTTISNLTSSQTFSLNCTGPGGNAVAMVSINVLGSLQISWQAPTENVDGSPIDGLSAYRIHVGTSSGSYDDIVEVGGNASNHTLNLIQGQYYLAMTAVDLDGDESALSNEVVKQSL